MRKEWLRQTVPELDYSKLSGTLFHEIEAVPDINSLTGGWVGGLAIASQWDPTRSTDWRCWARAGEEDGQYCGVVVKTEDELGLCELHRNDILGPGEEIEAIACLGNMAIEQTI